MPELKPLKLFQGDVLYYQEEHAEEIYMIKEGRIKLHVDVTGFLIEADDALI